MLKMDILIMILQVTVVVHDSIIQGIRICSRSCQRDLMMSAFLGEGWAPA